MEDSVEEHRKRCRRRRLLATHLSLICILLLHRICTAAADFGAESQNVAVRRLLGENPVSDHARCSDIEKLPQAQRCDHARRHCKTGRSVVNYISLHYCVLKEQSWISVPLLFVAVILSFFYLAETAEKFFSPVATLMVEILHMSPTMGGVTLLALGNGAPDVFASMAAIGGGNSRIGLGAIVSAGTFVSAFVVGSVAVLSAPFSVKPVPFVRDVLFYITAVGFMFLIYMKGVITFWQSIGLILFYAVFISVVVIMDQVKAVASHTEKSAIEASGKDVEQGNCGKEAETYECDEQIYNDLLTSSPSRIWEYLQVNPCTSLKAIKVKPLMGALFHVILRATIPETNTSKWNKYYATANVLFCPLLLLLMFKSTISLDYPVVFLLLPVKLPLWSLVLVQNMFLALAYFITAKPPSESVQIPVAFMAFMMSVFWISFIAGELLGCLAGLGIVLGISPALLGLTVLAWGNSMGDLVADVAIARAGKPEMAIAGCFAGPMFNMLVGLGFALVLHTSYAQPAEYYLTYHPSLLIAFGFLFVSLVGSLLVVALSKFRVTRLWGMCLIGLYSVFTVVSLFSAGLSH